MEFNWKDWREWVSLFLILGFFVAFVIAGSKGNPFQSSKEDNYIPIMIDGIYMEF